MASTLVSSLLYSVRQTLKETAPVQAPFWNDQELIDIVNRGAKDLWRAIVDLYEHHFLTINDTDVFIQANSSVLMGVPDDCYRVVLIEPRVIGGSSPNPGLIFKPLHWQDGRFQNARALSAASPNNQVVYYDQHTQGAPVGAPVVRIGPQLSDSVLLTIAYNHTLAVFDEDDTNPIPGESDNALIAWTVAYARAKERDDTAPDPKWLQVYNTEKMNLIKQIPPRQIQEPEFVEGMFEGYEFGNGF